MRGHRFDLVAIDDQVALSEAQVDCLRRFAVRAEVCRAPESAGRLSEMVHGVTTMAIAPQRRKGLAR